MAPFKTCTPGRRRKKVTRPNTWNSSPNISARSRGLWLRLRTDARRQAEHARAAAIRIRDEQLAITAHAPNDAAAWSRLAYAYAVLGEKSSALEAADKSVARSGAPNQSLAPVAVALRHAQSSPGSTGETTPWRSSPKSGGSRCR